MDKTLSTNTFRMSQRSFITLLARKHGLPYAIPALIVIIALIITAVILSDLRYLILALMLLFIVIPMIAALLYINYALSPLRAFNALPHAILLAPTNIHIKIFPRKKKKNKENEDKEYGKEDAYKDSSEDKYEAELGVREENKKEKEKDEDEEDTLPPTIMELPYDTISPYTAGLNNVTIPLKQGNASGFLYIPLSAFPSLDSFKTFLKELYSQSKQT